MIKLYNNGQEFLTENSTYLDTNKYMSSLFYIDAKLLNELSKKNYAIKVEEGSFKLLGIKLIPYNLLLFGDKECLKTLLDYLSSNEYEFDGIMCSSIIGDELLNISGMYYLSLGMDFMEASLYTSESSSEVMKATLDDVDELFIMIGNFFKDCGLPDKPNKDKITEYISNYRIIKKNNEIISMSALSRDTDTSMKITYVYTKPLYRGYGYAKKRRYINPQQLRFGIQKRLFPRSDSSAIAHGKSGQTSHDGLRFRLPDEYRLPDVCRPVGGWQRTSFAHSKNPRLQREQRSGFHAGDRGKILKVSKFFQLTN